MCVCVCVCVCVCECECECVCVCVRARATVFVCTRKHAIIFFLKQNPSPWHLSFNKDRMMRHAQRYEQIVQYGSRTVETKTKMGGREKKI